MCYSGGNVLTRVCMCEERTGRANHERALPSSRSVNWVETPGACSGEQ
jgi:hypothetical protein